MAFNFLVMIFESSNMEYATVLPGNIGSRRPTDNARDLGIYTIIRGD